MTAPGGASQATGCGPNPGLVDSCTFAKPVDAFGGDIWVTLSPAPPIQGGWTLVVRVVGHADEVRWPLDSGGILSGTEPQRIPVQSRGGVWSFEAHFEAEDALANAYLWGVHACQGGPYNLLGCE